jgi:predicted nucleic acid-binding protein
MLLDQAAVLDGATLRSLDAIHLAAAQTLGDGLVEVITYDQRLANAAQRIGLRVIAPG